MYEYNHEILKNEEILKLVKKAQDGCNESIEIIIKHNIKLVDSFIRRYLRVAEKEELLQEGVLGICEAIEKFKFDKQVAFSTYAQIRIKRRILYFLKKNRSIKIPHWVYETKDIEEYKKKTEIESFSKMYGEGIKLEELIGAEDKEINIIEQRDILERLLERLTSKERYVVIKNLIEENTLTEIGKVLKISKERVRQIKCSAIEKLKKRGIENDYKFRKLI